MAFIFTQLGADSFQRANESPLNPATWTNTFGGADVLEIMSDTCVISLTSDQDGAGQFIGVGSLPNDQYAEYSVSNINDETGGYLYLRWALNVLSTYRFTFIGPFNDNTGESFFIVDETNAAGDEIVYSWTDPDNGVPVTFQENDVFSFGVIGTKASGGHLYVFLNKNLIWTGNLADDPTPGLTSGISGIQLFSSEDVQTQFGIGVKFFVTGSLSMSSVYSVPDCRDYGTFPNNAVDVNGTETYTVPAEPSHVAPVDSRAAGAPSQDGTYPQNSRAPGTYGPGE